MYTDELPPFSARLMGHNQCREFTIGAGCFHTEDHLDPLKIAMECPRLAPQRCGQPLNALLHSSSFADAAASVSAGPDGESLTYHTKVLLLTELITEIRLCGQDNFAGGSYLGLSGLTFIRKDVKLTAGTVEMKVAPVHSPLLPLPRTSNTSGIHPIQPPSTHPVQFLDNSYSIYSYFPFSPIFCSYSICSYHLFNLYLLFSLYATPKQLLERQCNLYATRPLLSGWLMLHRGVGGWVGWWVSQNPN